MAQYFKEVNLDNDKEVLDFLTNHKKYNLMNSWNRLYGYANNIKIYNLDVTDEEKEKLYDLLSLDEPSFDIQMTFELLNQEFNEKRPGYYIIVNGRSDGYLVLSSETVRNYQDEANYPEELSVDERRELAKIVMDFDKFCDDYISDILAILNDREIVEEEVTYTKKIRVLRPKEE